MEMDNLPSLPDRPMKLGSEWFFLQGDNGISARLGLFLLNSPSIDHPYNSRARAGEGRNRIAGRMPALSSYALQLPFALKDRVEQAASKHLSSWPPRKDGPWA